VEPARNRTSGRGSGDQHVGDFVPQYVFERIMGVLEISRGKDHDIAARANRKACNPGRHLLRPHGILRGKNDSDRRTGIAKPHKLKDSFETARIGRFKTTANSGVPGW
jgi:hypothetical protein